MMKWIADNWLIVGSLIWIFVMMLIGHSMGFVRITVSFSAFIIAIIGTRFAYPYVVSFFTDTIKLGAAQSRTAKLIIILVVFICIRLLLKCFVKATKIIDKIPVIRGINQTLGAFLGMVFAVVVLAVVLKITGWGSFFAEPMKWLSTTPKWL